jgi:hypothetical protein
MKIVSTIARFLLGLIFVVFGLNGILQFIPMPAPTVSPDNSWERFSGPTIYSL